MQFPPADLNVLHHFSSPPFDRPGQLASTADALELLRGLLDQAISDSLELGEVSLSHVKSLWPSIQQVDGSCLVLSLLFMFIILCFI